MNIKWKDTKSTPSVLYFDDLKLNEGFRNVGKLSQGAVYIKVSTKAGRSVNNVEWMYEVATGFLFPPTLAPVERVEVGLDVPVVKPALYD